MLARIRDPIHDALFAARRKVQETSESGLISAESVIVECAFKVLLSSVIVVIELFTCLLTYSFRSIYPWVQRDSKNPTPGKTLMSSQNPSQLVSSERHE